MDHFKAGHPDDLVQDWYQLTPQQLTEIHRYIDEHRDEVEAEYQNVLRLADENRRYWEARNKERFEQIERLPKSPMQQAIRAKIEELKRKLDLA